MWQDETAKMVPCQDGHPGKQSEMDISGGGGEWIERHAKTDKRHEYTRPKLGIINSFSH